MKWPASLTIIRHGESAYNALRARKLRMPEYREFQALFDQEFAVARDLDWPSDRLKALAARVWEKTRLTESDYQTSLTRLGARQSYLTGKQLPKIVPIPNVIYVSPYVRTVGTLSNLTRGWRALKTIKTVPEERIREREHGMQLLFNDWRLYYTFAPMQGLLFKLEGGYHYRYMNGESKADVRERVRGFFGTLIREHANEHVLLVSHHLTLLSIRATLERWSPEDFEQADDKEKPINCGVTVYRGHPKEGKNGKLLLEHYNQCLY